jgi:hypothetical protein
LRAGEGSQEGSAVEEGKGERRVWREGELAEEMGHSHSLGEKLVYREQRERRGDRT